MGHDCYFNYIERMNSKRTSYDMTHSEGKIKFVCLIAFAVWGFNCLNMSSR